MAAILALAAALGWGASDFAAGRASRRAPVVAVVVLTYLTSTAVLVAVSVRWPWLGFSLRWGSGSELGSVALRIGRPALSGSPSAADLLWGAAAGVGGGLGAAMLYRGLSRGAAAVVAPVTALGGATVPLLWGLARGDAPGGTTQLGLLLALVAIVLISMTDPTPATPPAERDLEVTTTLGAPPALLARAAAATPRRARRGVRVLGLSLLAGPAAAMGPVLVARWQGSALSPAAFAVIGAAVAVAAISAATATELTSSPASSPTSPLGSRRRHARRLRHTRPRVTGARRRPTIPVGLAEAALAGLGFGSFFVFIDHTGGDAGLWPLISARGASVVLFLLAARWGRAPALPGPGARWASVAAGLGDAAAAVLYLWASHAGLLSIAVVLASLYPGITVLLSRVLEDEALARRQLGGLVLAGGAIALLVAGP